MCLSWESGSYIVHSSVLTWRLICLPYLWWASGSSSSLLYSRGLLLFNHLLYPSSFPTGSGTERWGLSGVLSRSCEIDYQDRNDFRISVSSADQVWMGIIFERCEGRFTQSSLYNPSSERQIVARDLQWNNSTCNLNSIIRVMDELNNKKTVINDGFARSRLKFASAFFYFFLLSNNRILLI